MSVEVVDVNLKMAPTKKVSKSKQVREYKILEIFKKKLQKVRSRQDWPNLPSLRTPKGQEGQQDRQEVGTEGKENLGTVEDFLQKGIMDCRATKAF